MTELSWIERALVTYGTRCPPHPRKWWVHNLLRQQLGVSLDRDLEVTRQGFAWVLNPADFSHESLFWLGTRDRWDLEHLVRLATPGGVVIDAGSNFGYLSLHLARRMGPSGRVHALEPSPANMQRLLQHIRRNGYEDRVIPHTVGLSDREEIVRLEAPTINSGHTHVAPDGTIEGVRLTTLDAFVDEQRLNRLDILILDVEGFEARALRGAGATLTRFRPLLLIELFPPVLAEQGATPESVAACLEPFGYRLFAAERDRLEPLHALPHGDQGLNVFAIPSEA